MCINLSSIAYPKIFLEVSTQNRIPFLFSRTIENRFFIETYNIASAQLTNLCLYIFLSLRSFVTYSFLHLDTYRKQSYSKPYSKPVQIFYTIHILTIII